VAELIHNRTTVAPSLIEKLPDVRTWVRQQFIQNHELLSSRPSRDGLSGLDLILLLSWVVKKFQADSDDFVLTHCDLHPGNTIVDDQHNLVGYIF
jgi:thiamine kinase-like enzyme